MQPQQDSDLTADGERGFTLVTVLWIVGLLAIMTGALSVSVRTHVRVVANVTESAKAEALADGGASLAVLDLMSAQGNSEFRRRFPPNGLSVACSVPGQGLMSISVSDEGGKIDVNTAGTPLLRALLGGLGVAPDKSAQVADAIFDYRDADDNRQPNGAESAEYKAAGLAWLPKNGKLQSIEELSQVYGMTSVLLARLKPYLSVYSGLEGVDAARASPDLIALLRSGMATSGGSISSLPEFDASFSLPAMFVVASPQRVFGVRVEARSIGGAVFVREAVFDTGSRQLPDFGYLRWTRGGQSTDAAQLRTMDSTVPIC